MSLLCGIDIGTSATKVLLYRPNGKRLPTASVEYPVYTPKPGWSEQEPEDWWKATVKGIAAACKKAKVKYGRKGGGLTFHLLRHTGASRMVAAGIDLRTVQALGNWSDIRLLSRYAHADDARKVAAVNAVGSLATPT